MIRSAPGGLGYLSMAVRSPASGTDAGAVVYNGQANLNNLSVPFAALSATGSLLWSKAVRFDCFSFAAGKSGLFMLCLRSKFLVYSTQVVHLAH